MTRCLWPARRIASSRFKKRRQVLERNHVRSVRRRFVRILMRLDENAGDADRDRRARQHRNIVPLRHRTTCPARPAAAPNAWRRRSPARRFFPAPAAHACRRRACCSRTTRRARSPIHWRRGVGNFGDDISHVPWREELTFLHIDHAPGFRCGNQKIRLPAQKTPGSAKRPQLRRRAHIAPPHAHRSAPAHAGSRAIQQRSAAQRRARCRGRLSPTCGWPCRTRSL